MVGTGIGVGLVVNNRPIHGLVHPEGGHVMLNRPKHDAFKGWADIHLLSVDSMASTKASVDRAKVASAELAELKDDNPIWDDVAYYLAKLCLTICYMISPHVIVLSGGLIKRDVLRDRWTNLIADTLQLTLCFIILINIILIDWPKIPMFFGAIDRARRALLKIE